MNDRAPSCWQERIRIDGPHGALAGRLAWIDGDLCGGCLIIGPHPLMGGRMDNNVVRALVEALAATGRATLAFDYAGSGESGGASRVTADALNAFLETGRSLHDPFMIEDARRARDWLHARVSGPISLVGYSFGAHVAVCLAGADTASLVLVAPTFSRHDYTPSPRYRGPIGVVLPEADFAAEPEAIEAWHAEVPRAVTRRVETGDHFFRGREAEVGRLTVELLGLAPAPETRR